MNKKVPLLLGMLVVLMLLSSPAFTWAGQHGGGDINRGPDHPLQVLPAPTDPDGDADELEIYRPGPTDPDGDADELGIDRPAPTNQGLSLQSMGYAKLSEFGRVALLGTLRVLLMH